MKKAAPKGDVMEPETAHQTADMEQRYRAPALEKGLDILELLAASSAPITMSAIVKQLGRSTGELFRMILVLEHRGFIERISDGEGYRLTDKLLRLSLDQPLIRGLVEIALPHMRTLSEETGQSCHLAMHSRGQIVVVARMESREEIGFSVRVGYRRSLHSTISGQVLYAFQGEQTRTQWESYFEDASPEELVAFRKAADGVRRTGFAQGKSHYVPGIVDLSRPVMRGEVCGAALTIPFVRANTTLLSLAETLARLADAAARVSGELLQGDARI